MYPGSWLYLQKKKKKVIFYKVRTEIFILTESVVLILTLPAYLWQPRNLPLNLKEGLESWANTLDTLYVTICLLHIWFLSLNSLLLRSLQSPSESNLQ